MKKVSIYTLETCHYCQVAKEYFKEKGIEYTELDAMDSNNRMEAKEKSGQLGVPVIVISDEEGGEEVIIGFDEEKIGAALA